MSRIVFVVIVFVVVAVGCQTADPRWGKVYEECMDMHLSGGATAPLRVIDNTCRRKADKAVSKK